MSKTEILRQILKQQRIQKKRKFGHGGLVI